MTSVLAIVSLPFSAAHPLCRHYFSPLRFMFCFSERMLSAIPFFLLFALSLSSYVLADDVLSSPFIPHFLVLGHSPFPFSRLHTLSVEVSLFLCRRGFVHTQRELTLSTFFLGIGAGAGVRKRKISGPESVFGGKKVATAGL